jgi:hypothetical protein
MEKELRTNAVHLNSEEQYQIRKSIIRLWKNGKSNEKITEIQDRHKTIHFGILFATLGVLCTTTRQACQ